MIVTLAGLILATVLAFNTSKKLGGSNPLGQQFMQVATALFVLFGAVILAFILMMVSPLTMGITAIIGMILVVAALVAAIVALVFSWQTFLAAQGTDSATTALVMALAVTTAMVFGGISTLGTTNLVGLTLPTGGAVKL
jgi:hypothetical protein